MKTLTCKYCSKTFFRTKSAQFCSKECEYNFVYTEKICERCGTTFSVRRVIADKRKHCSAECAKAAVEERKPQYFTTFICKYCGKEFSRQTPPSSKNTFEFCSPTCRNKARTKPTRAAKTKTMRIEVSKRCPVCGENFKSENKRTYCSKKCKARGQYTRTKKIKSQVPKISRVSGPARATFICERCGKEFEGWVYRKPRFCSKICGTYSHKICTCQICGKEFEEYNSRTGKYCSMKCSKIAKGNQMVGKGNYNYKGGNDPRRGPHWGRITRQVRKRDSQSCQVCGKTWKSNRVLISVHHIIPYRLFNGDHERANCFENLISLCPSCHASVECGKVKLPEYTVNTAYAATNYQACADVLS